MPPTGCGGVLHIHQWVLNIIVLLTRSQWCNYIQHPVSCSLAWPQLLTSLATFTVAHWPGHSCSLAWSQLLTSLATFTVAHWPGHSCSLAWPQLLTGLATVAHWPQLLTGLATCTVAHWPGHSCSLAWPHVQLLTGLATVAHWPQLLTAMAIYSLHIVKLFNPVRPQHCQKSH